MVSIKIIILIAVLVLGLSVNLYINYNNSIKANQLTGYAGSSGFVNITVSAVISVNFTQDKIMWGAGSINGGESNATLETSIPSVTRGNWSTVGISGFIIENIGTANVTLSLNTNKNATSLLGGSAGNRAYMWNATSNKIGSCNPQTFSNATYLDVNTTGYTFCNQFGYADSQDTLRLDMLLTVPYDGNVGVLTDTITATAMAAP